MKCCFLSYSLWNNTTMSNCSVLPSFCYVHPSTEKTHIIDSTALCAFLWYFSCPNFFSNKLKQINAYDRSPYVMYFFCNSCKICRWANPTICNRNGSKCRDESWDYSRPIWSWGMHPFDIWDFIILHSITWSVRFYCSSLYYMKCEAVTLGQNLR